MPTYKVTQKAEAKVFARSTAQAIEEVSNEYEFTGYTYEVEEVTPAHKLNEIKNALLETGVSVYYDDFRNNLHDFLRVSINESHPDDDENGFFIQVTLDENEEFDGKSYQLFDSENVEIATIPAQLNATVLAYLFTQEMRNYVKKSKPAQVVASLYEIATQLTAMGYPATMVDLGRYVGQPKIVELKCPKGNAYTLYQNLDESDKINGTGFHLSIGDDENEFVAQIGNVNTARVCAEIVAGIALVKWGSDE